MRVVRVVRVVVLLVLAAVVGLVGCVYLAPVRTTNFALALERQRAGLEKKTVTLPGGLRMVYLEGGSGDPVVLVHGFGADKDNFTRVARDLTPHYRVIIPDLAGFGESDKPADADYAPIAQAERIHAFATALGATPMHLGGSSMGGQIALTYAARHPDAVRTLWLLAPAGVWTAPPSEIRVTYDKTGKNPLLVRSEEEFAQLLELVMEDPPYLPRPMVNVMARWRIANADLEERIFTQIFTDSVEGRVAGLPTRTLIVWGDRDRALHVASGEVLRALIPNATLVIMPGIGHAPMIERPKESATRYLEFLRSP
ncbi:MAG: alpha/beta fold hydrolase [Gemmatimonadales bacterium]|nr:alpha/beta fold hydrolase [Gemmatimonadales bacterium]